MTNQAKLTPQMIAVLEKEKEVLSQMIVSNTFHFDPKDPCMHYMLYAWSKYYDAMQDVIDYFHQMQERTKDE